MKRFIAMIAVLALGACATVQPDVSASVGSGGPAASVGVDAGPVNVGVGTGGTYASVDVVETENVDVTVGTGGPRASVRVGHSPVRLGIGRGGWRIGI